MKHDFQSPASLQRLERQARDQSPILGISLTIDCADELCHRYHNEPEDPVDFCERGVLTKEHIQEGLSRAFIHAMAARAGLICAESGTFDYGVDGTFRPVVIRNGKRYTSSSALDFQARSTINWEYDGKNIVYDLDADTFNDLLSRTKGVSSILILLCLPSEDIRWLETTETETILRHCCYWFRPSGVPTSNTSTIRVRIPRENLLTPESLSILMLEASIQDLAI
jgi:hypothetical protein